MKRITPFLPWLIALLLIAFALLHFESDLLWKVQQYNLFLDTPLFFREQMVVSGGFLSYISCYFTQFFYHPWLGVLILCAWWLLLMWLIKRTFRIPNRWVIVTLIPVAILLIANMCLGYWHFFLRLQGYFFVATIGTTVGVALLWAFRALPEKLWVRIAFIVLATVIGYPLFGIYALAAVLFMAIWIWHLSDKRVQNIILSVVALLCIVAIPLFYYRYVYYQTFISDIWTTALPDFTAAKSFPRYYIPYYMLALFFLVMVIGATPILSKVRGEESSNSPKNSKNTKKQLKNQKKQSLIQWGLQGLLLAVLIGVVYHFWYKDDNFHHEIIMQRCIEKADWVGVLNEGKKQRTEPTRSIIMMHNIALSRVGRQTEEMYQFPEGKKNANTVIPFDMLHKVFSKTIYYQYGLLNDCHRMCVEKGVEYGWQVESLQYLASCSLLSGERQAAQKILDKLRHTKYHGEWADSMQVLLDNPLLIRQDRAIGPITHMLRYKNALGFDEDNVEKYVMNALAYQDSNDPYFQEQAVIAALWKRNPGLFWARFNRYTRLFPRGPIPRIFQEAAYFFGKNGQGPNPDMLPIDESVKKSYYAFIKEASNYSGVSAQTSRTILRPLFGNTFFYAYNYGMKY